MAMWMWPQLVQSLTERHYLFCKLRMQWLQEQPVMLSAA
jgi:hypothetical protein